MNNQLAKLSTSNLKTHLYSILQICVQFAIICGLFFLIQSQPIFGQSETTIDLDNTNQKTATIQLDQKAKKDNKISFKIKFTTKDSTTLKQVSFKISPHLLKFLKFKMTVPKLSEILLLMDILTFK